MRKGAKGMFVTFEGIDGCGKTTLLHLLGRYIWDLDKHNHVLFTREPYKDRDIRKILTEDENPYSRGLELAELFVEDRKEHIYNMVVPAVSLGENVFVLSDRYDLSTLAYQQTQGVGLDVLLKMHDFLPNPDLTFIVDVPPHVALERMRNDSMRGKERKFETDVSFMGELRMNYLDLRDRFRERSIYLIDNSSQGSEEVFEKQVKFVFDEFLKQRI